MDGMWESYGCFFAAGRETLRIIREAEKERKEKREKRKQIHIMKWKGASERER